MSQASVEQILGRLLTDGVFRQRFLTGRLETELARYSLTETELRALQASRSALRSEQLESLELLIDPSICRATIQS